VPLSYSSNEGMINQVNQQSHFSTGLDMPNFQREKSDYGNYSFPSTYQSENFSWLKPNINEHTFSPSYQVHNGSRIMNYLH
jgi:hypothetical protein